VNFKPSNLERPLRAGGRKPGVIEPGVVVDHILVRFVVSNDIQEMTKPRFPRIDHKATIERDLHPQVLVEDSFVDLAVPGSHSALAFTKCSCNKYDLIIRVARRVRIPNNGRTQRV
jgi:hypothetical protein